MKLFIVTGLLLSTFGSYAQNAGTGPGNGAISKKIEHETCKIQYLSLHNGDQFGAYRVDSNKKATLDVINLLVRKGYVLTDEMKERIDRKKSIGSVYGENGLIVKIGTKLIDNSQIQCDGSFSSRVENAFFKTVQAFENLSHEVYYEVVADGVTTHTIKEREKKYKKTVDMGSTVGADQQIEELNSTIAEHKEKIKGHRKEIKGLEKEYKLKLKENTEESLSEAQVIQTEINNLKLEITAEENSIKPLKLSIAMLRTLKGQKETADVTESLTENFSISVTTLAYDKKTFFRLKKAEDEDFVLNFVQSMPECVINANAPKSFTVRE